MRPLRLQLDNNLIQTLYLNNLCSTVEIAKTLGVNRLTVCKRLRLMDVAIRNQSEAYKASYKRGRPAANLKATDDQLRHLFVDEKLSPKAIAEMLGYCGPENIRTRLQKLNLLQPLGRKVSEADWMKVVEIYEAGCSCEEIATKFGVSHSWISKHLRDLGKIRTPIESKRIRGTILSGDKNPQWRGGRFQDSNGYIQVKNHDHPQGKNRHSYVFEHTIVWEEYHNRKLPEGYLIHHLNGIKNDNRPQNLIAMTRKDHHHQIEPYKKRIRELEIENRQLRHALEANQSIFYISEN